MPRQVLKKTANYFNNLIMKKYSLLFVFTVIMMGVASSCGGDDDNLGNGPNAGTESNEVTGTDAVYDNKLMGTSWKQTKQVGTNWTEPGYEGILTFGYNHEWYVINFVNKYNAYGVWEVKDGVYDYDIKASDYTQSSLRAQFAASLFGPGRIEELTETKLVLKSPYNDTSSAEFVKVSYREGAKSFDGGSGSGNSGGSTGDAPYVTSFDFTATKSSITVKFMCSERPTSATVKYGTSSPTSTASSSISGKQVSATVSGLKSGTKYYFKCTVKNSYGSSTSDTFSAITNY